MKNIKGDTLEFSIVVKEMQIFLEPVFEAIVNEGEWKKQWTVNSGWRYLDNGNV